MKANYFDIETYSPGERPDPETDKIISIQFQSVNLKSGESEGKLQILKEWESSEEEIVREVHKWFFSRPWQFIPLGFNLNFEWKFLSAKFKKYNLEIKELSHYYDKYPQIDLKPFAIIKRGEFIGASLSSISNKKDDGYVIKEFYENKEYDKIIAYIEDETKSFIRLYKKIKDNIDFII